MTDVLISIPIQRKFPKGSEVMGKGGERRARGGVEGEFRGPSIMKTKKGSYGRTEHEFFGKKGSKRH